MAAAVAAVEAAAMAAARAAAATAVAADFRGSPRTSVDFPRFTLA